MIDPVTMQPELVCPECGEDDKPLLNHSRSTLGPDGWVEDKLCWRCYGSSIDHELWALARNVEELSKRLQHLQKRYRWKMRGG